MYHNPMTGDVRELVCGDDWQAIEQLVMVVL